MSVVVQVGAAEGGVCDVDCCLVRGGGPEGAGVEAEVERAVADGGGAGGEGHCGFFFGEGGWEFGLEGGE